MQSYFYHLQLNIDFNNLPFYKKLMTFLGWSVIFQTESVCGFKSSTNGDLWFVNSEKKEKSNFDNRGVNHLAIRIEATSDIDATVEFLKEENTETLFDTPTHRPEFASSPNETYYQVMFTTPDNILFEIVYIGSKE